MAGRKTNPVDDRAAGYFASTEEVAGSKVKQEVGVGKAKRTYYLPTDSIMLLDEIQLNEFKRTGKKPDLSELIAESIHLLAESKRAS